MYKVDEVRALIDNTKGKFFSISFIKRTNGAQRRMLARIGVKKGIKGVGLSYNPLDRDLMVVWDRVKKQFRMVSLDSVIHFKCGVIQRTFNEMW